VGALVSTGERVSVAAGVVVCLLVLAVVCVPDRWVVGWLLST
jgi:hypothetical protein